MRIGLKRNDIGSFLPLDHFDRGFGQGVEERFSVALGEDAVVEDANEAFVAGGAD
jgi:hypothetical protein